ncbi:hypothetical protein [Marivita geojedonensis]|nr:hypothetical protein [Marivita geojedonensis]PRY73257.1 hypothetical protein CLV76_1319 [Marivita geojedonensis]
MPDSQIETERLILMPPALEHLDAYVSYCASERGRASEVAFPIQVPSA